MRIYDQLLDLLISRHRIEYRGCHCPNNAEPLWGRSAYWMVYTKDEHYITKITTPVSVMEPTEDELKILLKAELRKRIEAICERCETNDYGQVYIVNTDPYSVRSMLKSIEGKYPLRTSNENF